MDSDSLETIVYIVVFVFWVGFQFLRNLAKRGRTVSLPPESEAVATDGAAVTGASSRPGPLRAGAPTVSRHPGAGATDHIRSEADAVLDHVGAALARLETETREVDRMLGGGGRAARAVRETLQHTVAEPLADIDRRWKSVKALIDQGSVPGNFREHLQVTLQWCAEFDKRIDVIRSVAKARGDRAQGEMLDDADQIARAFVRPFGEFARAHEITFPEQHPISVIGGSDDETVWIDLLPQHPIVNVPRDFDSDLFRWLAVPHEIAHVIWVRVPGLAREVGATLGLTDSSRLFDPSREDLRALPRRLFSAWLPEIFADFITVITAGPAAVHGMMHVFEDPESPENVTAVAIDRAGDYDEHPPAHMRVLLACRLLQRMGFIRQAGDMEDAWCKRHPEADGFVIPLRDRQAVRYEADDLASFGASFIEPFYHTQFASLDGRNFEQIPGLEMSPGLWHKVLDDAEALTRPGSFHDDARVVICAAIEARHRNPGSAATITRATRTAIVGAYAPLRDRRVERARPTARKRYSRSEFRDALVLADVAHRRIGARRPGVSAASTPR